MLTISGLTYRVGGRHGRALFNEASAQIPEGSKLGLVGRNGAGKSTLLDLIRGRLMPLDEPTNHLDLEAALWLENYLRHYRYSFVLVSHDRRLLNAATTTTLHLDNGKLTLYSGGFDQFLRARREATARQAALAQRQLRQRAHLQEFVDRFRYKASKARQAQSRLKALARLDPVALIEDAAALTLR